MRGFPLKMKATSRINPLFLLRKAGWLFVAFLFLTFTATPLFARDTSWREHKASPQEAGDKLHYLRYNETKRSYRLFIPSGYTPGRSVPLVIALHGGGGNAGASERMTGLSAYAESKNFILVHPNGSGRFSKFLLTWNTGNCCGYAHEHQVDDVGFIRYLIDTLSAEYSIDPKRIYATGMSNGGKMSYRLACFLADKIAAIAPVVGSMEEPDCRPVAPVSVMAFNGMADEHILYEGGAPKKAADRHPRVDNSAKNSVGYWVKRNHCNPVPRHSQSGSVIRDAYYGCEGGSEVMLYSIVGGGHAWPGGKQIRHVADAPTMEISASKEIVDFFLAHPRR